ncbi:g_PROTEIN_RECEP_F1_2 domain-containing protein [Caerostris extrusa]|uniref:G_PROTEIN_RECEP_F1_2 domain-containing protein n=1 Tax=Caerostris extrusa TaxID=172846 RepID=A0AAV4SF90_CAEEX|nr:g_PROTEIN_RECEP_F1_2 domain-containing protein [Caerostris extrusa]
MGRVINVDGVIIFCLTTSSAKWDIARIASFTSEENVAMVPRVNITVSMKEPDLDPPSDPGGSVPTTPTRAGVMEWVLPSTDPWNSPAQLTRCSARLSALDHHHLQQCSASDSRLPIQKAQKSQQLFCCVFGFC